MAHTTTTTGQPAWLILAVLLTVVALALFAANALLGDTGSSTNTDPLVNTLCADSPDC